MNKPHVNDFSIDNNVIFKNEIEIIDDFRKHYSVLYENKYHKKYTESAMIRDLMGCNSRTIKKCEGLIKNNNTDHDWLQIKDDHVKFNYAIGYMHNIKYIYEEPLEKDESHIKRSSNNHYKL